MKKTLICLMLAGLMIVMTFAGCGKEDSSSTDMGSDIVTEDSSKNAPSKLTGNSTKDASSKLTGNSTKDASSKEVEVDLSQVYKVPLKAVAMDIPAWQNIEQAYTNIIILQGLKYVAITYRPDKEPQTLEEAHEIAFNDFMLNIQRFQYVNDLKIEKDEVVTINGIEMYRFEGTFECGFDDKRYKTHATGYSFIKDGIPVNITGTVLGADGEKYNYVGSSEELIFNRDYEDALMINTVDAIANTVRDTY